VPSEAADEMPSEESPEKLRRDRIGIPCDATSIICIGFTFLEHPNPKLFFGSIQEPEVFQKKTENLGFRLKTSGIDFQGILNPYLTRT
jgi:hypothetical protein